MLGDFPGLPWSPGPRGRYHLIPTHPSRDVSVQRFEKVWERGLGSGAGERLRNPRAVIALCPLREEARGLLAAVKHGP